MAIEQEKQSSDPSQKVINAMKKLDCDFNEIAQKIVEEAKAKVDQAHKAGIFETVANKTLNFLIDIVDLALSAEILPTQDEPKTFQQAWNNPDPVIRVKWREAIRKEFHDMNIRCVWQKIKSSQIPSNRRCVKTKWVLKTKLNGVYRARIVACG